MYNGYRTIFWGIFFSVFHINLGGLQILPAFVGWLIAAHGINLIYKEVPSPSFRKAYNFSLIMVVVSLIGPISTWVGASYVILDYVPVVFAIVELPVIYYLLEGSMENIKSKGDGSSNGDYEGTLNAYIIIFVLNIILECIAITFVSTGLLMIVAIIGMLLILWLMQIVHSLKLVQVNDVHDIG
jgi:hypothetical protein